MNLTRRTFNGTLVGVSSLLLSPFTLFGNEKKDKFELAWDRFINEFENKVKNCRFSSVSEFLNNIDSIDIYYYEKDNFIYGGHDIYNKGPIILITFHSKIGYSCNLIFGGEEWQEFLSFNRAKKFFGSFIKLISKNIPKNRTIWFNSSFPASSILYSRGC